MVCTKWEGQGTWFVSLRDKGKHGSRKGKSERRERGSGGEVLSDER